MRVLAEKTLRLFWEQHADAKGPLQVWYDHASHANWQTPADVQRDYGDDAILPNNRAVFNIKGKKYRIVAVISYKYRFVYIRFVGTHAEYNKIDVATI